MRSSWIVAAGLAAIGNAIAASAPGAQLPQRFAGKSGQTITPVFEGWYRNADGTVSLSFGYLNRNSEEAVDVPVGPGNFLAPGPANQGQPTHFRPGRHWGVFAVKVPAGSPEVVWTIGFRDRTDAIPGHQRRNWQIDALEGEAGAGNTPPVVRFSPEGPEGAGPLGVTAGPMTVAAGAPLNLAVWARDDGRASGSVATAGRGAAPVSIAWFPHQGPGRVAFGTPTARIPAAGGTASTTATFSEPGAYLVRVRANDASGVAGAGHAQCCWTNGFVAVTVTR
jgi:hypothetical protein